MKNLEQMKMINLEQMKNLEQFNELKYETWNLIVQHLIAEQIGWTNEITGPLTIENDKPWTIEMKNLAQTKWNTFNNLMKIPFSIVLFMYYISGVFSCFCEIYLLNNFMKNLNHFHKLKYL